MIVPINEFFLLPDEDLWVRFISGDEAAYKYIYEKFAPEIYNYGRHVVNDRTLVEDCMHDLFIYIYQRKEQLGHTTSIKFYLFTALRRRLFEQLQKQKKEVFQEEDTLAYTLEAVPSYETELIAHEHSSETAKIIGAALLKLPRRQREVMYLLYFRNFTYQEAAAVMELEVRTVYNQAHRSIQALRKMLSDPSKARKSIKFFNLSF